MKITSSCAPAEKRESCQATASVAFLPTATEPRIEPSRIVVPVSGSTVPSVVKELPLLTASYYERWLFGLEPEGGKPLVLICRTR